MGKGAKLVSSMTVSPALSFCQWASSPSPRQDTMPIPVMQPSRAASVIRGDLHRHADVRSQLQHTAFELVVGEIDNAKHDGSVAHDLAVNLGPCLGYSEAGAFVNCFSVEIELVAGFDKTTE